MSEMKRTDLDLLSLNDDNLAQRVIENNDVQNCLAELSTYKDAEEQGLLIKFPCKVGDTVYVLTNDSPSGYEKTSVCSIRLTKNSYRVICKCMFDDWGSARWEFTPQDFGKRYFLTEEAVEKALSHD